MTEPTKEEKEAFVKNIKDYVVDYLKREKPWVLLMDNEILEFIDQRKSGTITFSVRVHQGQAQDMVVEILPSSKVVKFNFIRNI